MATREKILSWFFWEGTTNQSGRDPELRLPSHVYEPPFQTTEIAQQFVSNSFQRGINREDLDNSDFKAEADKQANLRYETKIGTLEGISDKADERIAVAEEKSKQSDAEWKEAIEAEVKPKYDTKLQEIKEEDTENQTALKMIENAVKQTKCEIQTITEAYKGQIPQSRFKGVDFKYQATTIGTVAVSEGLLFYQATQALGTDSPVINIGLSLVLGTATAITGHAAGKAWAREELSSAVVSTFGCFSLAVSTIYLRSQAPNISEELIIPVAAISGALVWASGAIAYVQNRILDPQHSAYFSAKDKLKGYIKDLGKLRAKTKHFDKREKNIKDQCDYEITVEINARKAQVSKDLASYRTIKTGAAKQIKDYNNHIASELVIIKNKIDAAYAAGKQQADF